MGKLTLFYDSQCPLCSKEIEMLKRLDNADKIDFVDLFSSSLALDYPHINQERALEILHVQRESGEMVLGLDATHLAWSAVGRGYLTAPLRWPIIGTVADFCYRVFAKYRHKLIPNTQTCDSKRCK